jgi:hypothetical protein
MKRIALILAAIIGVSMFATSPAQAGMGTIRINNNTNRSVWITMYSSCGWTCSWSIIGNGYGTFCVGAHQSKYMDDWKTHPIIEFKVRAEVKLRADCGGPNIGDTYDTRKFSNDNPDSVVANINAHGNDEGFYLKFVGN